MISVVAGRRHPLATTYRTHRVNVAAVSEEDALLQLAGCVKLVADNLYDVTEKLDKLNHRMDEFMDRLSQLTLEIAHKNT